MARLTSFEVGYCTHPACVVSPGAGWASCRFPSRAYLIEAQGRRWLWDTGYASHFQDHTRRGLFSLYRRVTPVHLNAEEALVRQLKARGIAPADLSGIVLSHFHGDHVAGLRDFPGVPLIGSGPGWQATRGLRGVQALRRAFVPGLMPDDTDQRMTPMESFPAVDLPSEAAPFSTAHALPGSAGEVLLTDLPGHAAGHIGAFVLTGTGWTLLASDAAWTHDNYRALHGPSRLTHLVMDDPRAYHRTLGLLHRLHAGQRVRVMLTHEEATP